MRGWATERSWAILVAGRLVMGGKANDDVAAEVYMIDSETY